MRARFRPRGSSPGSPPQPPSSRAKPYPRDTALAALEGVDALWLGHFDLSASLGIPGEFDHPRFRDATRRICAAAQKHGKGLGRLVTGEAEARRALEDGFRLIAWGGDAWLLQAAVAEGVGRLRGIAGA